jgi:hypothetical protein
MRFNRAAFAQHVRHESFGGGISLDRSAEHSAYDQVDNWLDAWLFDRDADCDSDRFGRIAAHRIAPTGFAQDSEASHRSTNPGDVSQLEVFGGKAAPAGQRA